MHMGLFEMASCAMNLGFYIACDQIECLFLSVRIFYHLAKVSIKHVRLTRVNTHQRAKAAIIEILPLASKSLCKSCCKLLKYIQRT